VPAGACLERVCLCHMRGRCLAMDFVFGLWRRVAGAITQAHLTLLIAVCGEHVPGRQQAWDKLFERHPEDEVLDIDTTPTVCQAVSTLWSTFVANDGRRPLMFFTSFAGSGKSRLCGKFGTFVEQLRHGDAAAVAAMEREAPASHPSASAWASKLLVVGLNFNSKRWSVGGLDKALSEYGLLVPLYLRIVFFLRADLASSEASTIWAKLCEQCLVLLRFRRIDQGSLYLTVVDLLRHLAGASPPYLPLVIVVDELQKVKEFFSPDASHTGDAYRSEICRLADVVTGYAIFTSLNAQLMTDETSTSGRPTLALLRLPQVSTRMIFEEALLYNVQRGMYLNFNGVLATWGLAGAPPGGTPCLAGRGAAALASLVGADVRFATFLARQLMTEPAGASTVFSYIENAARRTAFTLGTLWEKPYGPAVLAHVILGGDFPAARRLTDSRRQPLPYSWDDVRLRGHVLAVGGTTLQPMLPLYALWPLVKSTPGPNDHVIYRGIRLILSWSSNNVSWCGWEVFFQACLMVLSNARALVSTQELSSLAALYSSSTHVGGDSILVDRIIEAVQDRLNVQTTTLPRLIKRFIDGDMRLVNYVWHLNQGAAAVDAAVLDVTSDGELALTCIQLKFSVQDASSSLSWSDSCDWVTAMQARCAMVAGESWQAVQPRVAFLVAARRKRGARYAADKAAHSCAVMDKAIVLCWEDMDQCLGSFLHGLVEHAETLFEAEVLEDDSPQG